LELFNQGCFERNKNFIKNNPEAISKIGEFSVLWAAFECGYFDKDFRTNKISTAVSQIKTINNIDIIINNFKDDIKNRRIALRLNINDYVKSLRLRPNEARTYLDLVQNFIDNKSNNLDDKIMAAIIICYRIRNNMFHGEKDEVEMGQELFEKLNNFIKKITI